jgi:hypothetical protein
MSSFHDDLLLLPLPLNQCKGIFCRKKTIGRQKDGRKVKQGTYDYQGACESHGLAHSAPPQHVTSAVMSDCLERRHAVITPLKAELQRELKKALACNVKNAATIKCLKKEKYHCTRQKQQRF